MEENTMAKTVKEIEVCEDDVNKLLPMMGYGYYHEADIVFFGNEEGLGGLPMDAVFERIRLFGNNPNSYLDKNDMYGGYWYQSEINDIDVLRDSLNEIYKKEDQPLLKKEVKKYFPILDFQGRILLHLHEPDKDWFQEKPWYQKHNTDSLELIEDTAKSLYGSSRKYKAALLDWRPLPRPTEDVWPYANIDEKKYMGAFKLNKKYLKKVTPALKSKDTSNLDKYDMILYKRIKTIERAITSFSFPLLVAAGDPKSKMALFELILSDYNIKFDEYELSGDKNYYKAVVKLPNRELTILVTKFFNHYGNCLQLSGLKGLVENEIENIFL